MEKINLRCCPFCGGKARLFVNQGIRVVCTKCGAQTACTVDHYEDSESTATYRVINLWNKRFGQGFKDTGPFYE